VVAAEHRTPASERWLWATVACTIGAFVAAIVLAPASSVPAPAALTWLLFLTSSVHVASTGFLFSFPQVRRMVAANPRRYLTAPAVLVVASGAAAVLVSHSTLVWLLVAYFAWQQWHYQKQNLGIAALAALALGLRPLDATERRVLLVSGAAGIVGLVAHPSLLQLDAHPNTGPLFAAASAVFIAAVLTGLVSLVRRASTDRPAAFTTMYLASLLFSAPVFVFSSPYAAVGGMTIAHGLQYLLLVGMVGAGMERGLTRLTAVALCANIALIGGALLSGASHLHSSGIGLRLIYGVYLGLVMAHFVVDAGLWRLRDPATRSFLSARLPYLVPAPAFSHTARADARL
jgi:hypothetical protein